MKKLLLALMVMVVFVAAFGVVSTVTAKPMGPFSGFHVEANCDRPRVVSDVKFGTVWGLKTYRGMIASASPYNSLGESSGSVWFIWAQKGAPDFTEGPFVWSVTRPAECTPTATPTPSVTPETSPVPTLVIIPVTTPTPNEYVHTCQELAGYKIDRALHKNAWDNHKKLFENKCLRLPKYRNIP